MVSIRYLAMRQVKRNRKWRTTRPQWTLPNISVIVCVFRLNRSQSLSPGVYG